MTDAKQACGTVQASHCRMGRVPALPLEPSRTLQAGLVGLPRDATESTGVTRKWPFLRIGCQPHHGNMAVAEGKQRPEESSNCGCYVKIEVGTQLA